MWRTSIMNMRAEKGSFRESFKHYERRESTKVLGPNRHFELVFKKGQWRIVYEMMGQIMKYINYEYL
ncbi:hypothetical protein TNCT_431001 [Trichonephila clavata]|uniref:Uncharacterized protein n=1 Tax=Trichonephila clavata TaxID=2740835 RepID=A0A8X6KPW0_TRICU|nr:hypothetical protein TNCT_431001 [Trichonephila clavata]